MSLFWIACLDSDNVAQRRGYSGLQAPEIICFRFADIQFRQGILSHERRNHLFCLHILDSGFPLGRQKGARMPQVSFARHITPLFRDVEISHMARYGIKLDDYTFMSDPDNADKVLGALSPHEGDPPCMPSGGPYWTADQFALFTEWQNDGYQPQAAILGKKGCFGAAVLVLSPRLRGLGI